MSMNKDFPIHSLPIFIFINLVYLINSERHKTNVSYENLVFDYVEKRMTIRICFMTRV